MGSCHCSAYVLAIGRGTTSQSLGFGKEYDGERAMDFLLRGVGGNMLPGANWTPCDRTGEWKGSILYVSPKSTINIR